MLLVRERPWPRQSRTAIGGPSMSAVGPAPYTPGMLRALTHQAPNASVPLTMLASATVVVVMGPATSSRLAVPAWTMDSAILPVPHPSLSATSKRTEAPRWVLPFSLIKIPF